MANRLVAVAEEQAMEVIATLMSENESDTALMREIGGRMRLRPLSVVGEDDSDLKLLFQIKARIERRIHRLEVARKEAARISRLVA